MQTNSTLKSRLTEFLSYLQIGQAKFAKEVGLSRGFANNVGDSIRADNLSKISAIYPELNTAWLLTGEGQMLKNTDAEATLAPTTSIAIPMEVWEVIRNQAASLKAKDEQMNDMITNLKVRDGKLAESLERLEEKIDKKGEIAGNAGVAVG